MQRRREADPTGKSWQTIRLFKAIEHPPQKKIFPACLTRVCVCVCVTRQLTEEAVPAV